MPGSSLPEKDFSDRLLEWWQTNGRHDLPWQINRTPYRVWVSEIMLQQTQVTTVIGYFERFVARFPALPDLARAPLDDVLALWSGLGYYARARNLHKAAVHCLHAHDGQLPDGFEALRALPGIGDSTANAIIAQALDRRAPILDGNVKRVMARHAGIAGWPGRSAVARQLWAEADARTPNDRAADYTQAIMDLGATVCTTRNPTCMLCPVQADCRARLDGRIAELPGKKPSRDRPERTSTWLIQRDGTGRLALVRRPPTGIWGGLWCFPETNERGEQQSNAECLPPIAHEFTHFRLTMRFVETGGEINDRQVEDSDIAWLKPEEALRLGLPRPIRRAIESLADRMPGIPHSNPEHD